MELNASSLMSLSSSTSAVTLAPPAKTPHFSRFLFLCDPPSFAVRLHSSLPLLSTLFAIPVSRNAFLLRSSQPQKYVYPDPIPEFAQAETEKFRTELFNRLSQNKGEFGDDLDAVVHICAKIFSEFLLMEYGGPGTLMVEPFTDMLVALKKKKLPGAALAARASLLWAQNCVDQDWEVWNSEFLK